MDIENLEINILKASEIQEGDVILVKINENDKGSLSKEEIQDLYKKISSMIKKEGIGIYFFPDNLEISVIKNLISESVIQKAVTEYEYEKKYNNNDDINTISGD